MQRSFLPLFAAATTASLAAAPASGAVLNLSTGTDTQNGVTATINSGDLSPFVIETIGNPQLISLLDGDTTVERISSSGSSDIWEITITDPAPLNTKYLLLRDVDTASGQTGGPDAWQIETTAGSGIAPAGIVYLGGGDNNDDEVITPLRYDATFNALTGLFTGDTRSLSDPYFVLDITSVTGTFSLDALSGGTQWAIFVGEPIPEPSSLALLGLGGACLLSRRKRAASNAG